MTAWKLFGINVLLTLVVRFGRELVAELAQNSFLDGTIQHGEIAERRREGF
jgi:hypothetical protein